MGIGQVQWARVAVSVAMSSLLCAGLRGGRGEWESDDERAPRQSPHSTGSPRMSSLLSRRSTSRGNRLERLQSQRGEGFGGIEGLSCPNSPAVKKVFRLVVVGPARTGKTCIVSRFMDKEFEERYLPTIENFHRKIYKIKGECFQLDIVDSSGNDPFPAARKLSYISGDMFIIVGSVEHGAACLIDLWHQITEAKSSRGVVTNGDVPIVFALNKMDMEKHRWQVTEEYVRAKLVEEFGHDDNFVATSALENVNIEKLFGRIFKIARCPKHMNPEVHKMLRGELSADGENKKKILQRMRSRFSREDDTLFVYTDLNARRPSLRTDLLMNRSKVSVVNVQTVGKALPVQERPQKCNIM